VPVTEVHNLIGCLFYGDEHNL